MMKAFYPNWKNLSQAIFVLAFTLLLFSCSESPEPDKPQMQNPPPKEDPKENPDDDPAEVLTIYEQIEGKWLLGEMSFPNNRRASAKISTAGRTGIGSKLFGSKSSAGEGLRIAEEEGNPAFIEFLADSTYLLFEGGWSGELFRGKAIASGSHRVTLKSWGEIEGFDFKEGKFSFQLKKDGNATAISIEATKVEPYELDERTKLLSGDWYVEASWGLDYCDFDCLIGKEIHEYNRWEEIIGTVGVLEHYVMAFTPSGTVFWYMVIDGKVYPDEPFNWSWPDSGTEQIALYDGETGGIELTSDKLTLTATDEDGEYGVTFKAGPPYFED
jgi:hypothetical protein